MRHHVDHDQSGEYFITPAGRGRPPPAWLFEPASARARGALRGGSSGRRQAWFLAFDAEPLVLRHYWRGGFAARFSADLHPWLGLGRSRPVRELDLLEALRERSLPVPAAAGARVTRVGGLWYRGDLLMQRIPGAVPLAERIEAGAVDDRLWCRVGATLGAFHAGGAWHADLNARNILVDEEAGIWLIDWDRGRLRAPGRWRDATLKRLRRSLAKSPVLDAAARRGWRHLLAGYSNVPVPGGSSGSGGHDDAATPYRDGGGAS